MNPHRVFRLTGALQELATIEDLLRAEGFHCEPLCLHPKARLLTAEPFPLGRSLAARLGLLYIQDLASMVPPLLLAPPPGGVVLDLCASPGSKTGMLAEAVGRRGLVVANEPNPRRLATLRANLRQVGVVEAVTLAFARFPQLPHSLGFSHILVDAPCSGWGTAAKHPEVLRLWREEKTGTLEALQRQLLARTAALLSPGGTLVYSTCTTNRRENEDQIAWAVDTLGLVPGSGVEVPGVAMEATSSGCWRIVDPRAQGFFVAVLHKEGTPSASWREVSCPNHAQARAVRQFFPGAPAVWDDFVVFRRGQNLDLAPALALHLPEAFGWRGLELGRRGKTISWTLGCRALSSLLEAPTLTVEESAPIARLLAGESLGFLGPEGRVKLVFRNLFVGWLSRRAGRVVWTNR